MRSRWLTVCSWIGVFCSAAPAHGVGLLRLPERVYGDELLEIANVGDPALELPGRDFGDDTVLAGNASLPPPGVLAACASALLTERSAEEFRASWDLAVNLQVLGSHARNLGRADELDRYDPSSVLVDAAAANPAGSSAFGIPAADSAGAAPQIFPRTVQEPSAPIALCLALTALALIRRRVS